MAAVVLLIGILMAGLPLAGLLSRGRHEPPVKPLSNAEWFEQRRQGIRHPHAEIPPGHEPFVRLYGLAQLFCGVFLIVDACMRLGANT